MAKASASFTPPTTLSGEDLTHPESIFVRHDCAEFAAWLARHCAAQPTWPEEISLSEVFNAYAGGKGTSRNEITGGLIRLATAGFIAMASNGYSVLVKRSFALAIQDVLYRSGRLSLPPAAPQPS